MIKSAEFTNGNQIQLPGKFILDSMFKLERHQSISWYETNDMQNKNARTHDHTQR